MRQRRRDLRTGLEIRVRRLVTAQVRLARSVLFETLTSSDPNSTVRSDASRERVYQCGLSNTGFSRNKYDLPFTLIADTEQDVVQKYGVWAEKSMYGKKYMGINRTTFLIDESGKIAKIFDKVDVAKHADEVLEAFGEK